MKYSGIFCVAECRVLRMNLERKRLHLTSKPILVKEEFTVVDSYETAKVGTVTEVKYRYLVRTAQKMNKNGLAFQSFR